MESNVRNHADVFQMCFSPLRSVCKFGDHELGFHFLQELLVVVRPFNVGWLIKKLKLYFFFMQSLFHLKPYSWNVVFLSA